MVALLPMVSPIRLMAFDRFPLAGFVLEVWRGFSYINHWMPRNRLNGREAFVMEGGASGKKIKTEGIIKSAWRDEV